MTYCIEVLLLCYVEVLLLIYLVSLANTSILDILSSNNIINSNTNTRIELLHSYSSIHNKLLSQD